MTNEDTEQKDVEGAEAVVKESANTPQEQNAPLQTKATPANGSTASIGASSIRDDIQKILKDVRLPEHETSRVPGLTSPTGESRGVGKKLIFDTGAVAALSRDEVSKEFISRENVQPQVSGHTTPVQARDVVSQTSSLAGSMRVSSTPAASTTPPASPTPSIPHTSAQPFESKQLPKVVVPSAGPAPLPKVVVPPVSSVAAAASLSPKSTQKGETVSSLRTLKEDLQDIVKTKKISLVRAVALEEDKKQKRDLVVAGTPMHSSRTRNTLLLASLFLSLGVLALLGVYTVMRGQQESVAPLQSAIMFAEQTIPFLLNDQPFGEVKRNLAASRSFSELTLGAVARILPVTRVTSLEEIVQERPATLEEFFNALGIPAPNNLTRSLTGEFFFGTHVVDENAPLLVMLVSSYERAFAAMLAWEKTINADLSPVFTPVSAFTTNEDGLLIQRPFEDLIIRNYDVRALRDDNGIIQLYYSFPTRNILIIAESTYSFTEILSRLRAERRL